MSPLTVLHINQSGAGNLRETIEGWRGFWSPSLIEFPGAGLQCCGGLWSGGYGSREGGEDPPLRWPFTGTGGVECKELLEDERTAEAYCAPWMSRWHSSTGLAASVHLQQIFSQLTLTHICDTFELCVLVARCGSKCLSSDSLFTLCVLVLVRFDGHLLSHGAFFLCPHEQLGSGEASDCASLWLFFGLFRFTWNFQPT